MRTGGRPSPGPRRCWALAGLALGLLATCSPLEITHRYARADIEGLSYRSVYSLVATTLDSEGWMVRERDIEAGTLVTDWRYGPSSREFRGPTRLKVHVGIEPEGNVCHLDLRVETEVLVKGGMLAHDPRDSEDWEPAEDDFDRAELLLARIKALVRWTPPPLDAPPSEAPEPRAP